MQSQILRPNLAADWFYEGQGILLLLTFLLQHNLRCLTPDVSTNQHSMCQGLAAAQCGLPGLRVHQQCSLTITNLTPRAPGEYV